MARIRSIKPESCTDERLADCSTTARLLFAYMQCFCDDGGIHPAKARTLKAECFPMDDFSAEYISGLVAELVSVNLLTEFEADGQQYWAVNDWATLQKIEKPSFKHPRPDGPNSTAPRRPVAERSSTPPRPIDDGSPAEGREGRKESDSTTVVALTRSKAAPKRSLPEDFVISERVRTWAAERGFTEFLDQHFEHMVGTVKASGAKYVDWDEALMQYIRCDYGDVRKKSAQRGVSADPLAGYQ